MTRGDLADRVPAPGEAPGTWEGQTYYGRSQVKPAPFEPWVVGGYIFLAGLSGASAILGTLAHFEAKSRPRRQRQAREPMVRRSRYLSLLAPTIGSALLVYDLHTPKRFYNMLRIAKARSPMSIGTWILMSFSAFAGVSGTSQFVADLKPRWRWPSRVAAAAQVPAAITGAGLSTYTASLIAATSTPLWAAAPRATAMRFALVVDCHCGRRAGARRGIAAGAPISRQSPSRRADQRTGGGHRHRCAVSRGGDRGRALGSLGTDRKVRRDRSWGHAADRAAGRRAVFRGESRGGLPPRPAWPLWRAARSCALPFSGMGAESAQRPEISMRFAQPDNLPGT